MKKTQLILAIVLSLAMILTLSACKTTVAVSAEAKNGSVAGVGSYYAGDSVTLTATPDEGYEFAGWYNGNEKGSDENPYTFTVNGNITLKALFIRIVRYSLTVTADENGKISGSASGEYEAGEKISVTATPDEGFLFAGWFKGEEKVSDSATYEFVMPAEAVALTAKFEVKPAEKFSVVFYDYAGKVISAQEILYGESYTIVAGVKNTYPYLFWNMYVRTVTIDADLESIGRAAFARPSLTNFVVNGSIGVFTNSSLETLEIAEGNALEKIGTCAFYGTSLTSFTVPSTVTYFGESVFGGCYSLSEVNVDEGSTILKSIGGVLYNFDLTELIVFPAASAITEYVAPETLVKARIEAFAYARAESVTFNEGFLELGERAFFLSGVKKIVFPESFTTLYATALNSFMCDTLTLEFRSATIPEVKGEDTEEVIRVAYAESITIRVPEEAFDAYIVWLDSVTENYSRYLDTTGYVNLSTFEFYTGDGETPYQTIESKRLMSYPVPEWTGEGTKYFTGWFFDNGTWEEELITPCRREDNKTYKLYARWSDTARKDGTTEWWAYDIRVNQSLTITLKYDQPTVYFNVKLDKRYTGYLFILAYVNGKQQGQAQFIGEEIPENDIVKISLDFSQFMASTDVRSVEVRFDTWGTAASTSLDFQEPKSQEIPRIGLCLIDLSKRILVK